MYVYVCVYVCPCKSASMHVDARCMCKYISRITQIILVSRHQKTARPAFPVSSIALDNTYGPDISEAGRGICLQLMEEAAEWEEAVQRIV